MGEEALFTATLRRVSDRAQYAAPLIIGNHEHRFFILEALDALGVKDATVLLEPEGRNTSAAALASALHEPQTESSVLHLVLPSDHLVADENAFHTAVLNATPAAHDAKIVLFGITPERPETGYGYIMPSKKAILDTLRIERFHEKPDAETAASLIAEGALWNSGMFLYAPATLIAEAETLAPDMLAHCTQAVEQATPDGRCTLLAKEAYERMGNYAFDTLFMERTGRGAVLPCEMGWSDVGSWHALWQLAARDESGNALLGQVVAKDVTASYIRSQGPLVAVLGMENCTVIATKDAVLVAPSERAQEVKSLLASIEDAQGETAIHHTCVPRPWGTYENIAEGGQFKVKHIVVKPGRSLSMQMHHHRAEHWVVVSGTAKVESEGIEKLLFPNESIFIPKGSAHRLSNPGKIDLQIIEVQSGEYLKEDDIIRFEDTYGRVANG
jgi:mannose-1-phosphate guanylyltransferase/mannose-6-phosphate isomerase